MKTWSRFDERAPLPPEPCASFRPMMPVTIQPTETSRPALAESPWNAMPTTKVPAAPIPIQTA